MFIGLNVKYPFVCHVFMKLEFSRKNFEKILKYETSWKSVQWEPSCFMRKGRRTRHDEANSRFSQFFAKTPKQLDRRNFPQALNVSYLYSEYSTWVPADSNHSVLKWFFGAFPTCLKARPNSKIYERSLPYTSFLFYHIRITPRFSARLSYW